MQFRTIGVIGCGLMGTGIAQTAVQSGYKTAIYDFSRKAVDQAREKISQALARNVNRKLRRPADMEDALLRIQPVNSLDELTHCDIVIEAVTENMQVKKKLLTELDKICPPRTVLASNTSALSITEMAEETKRRELVGGLHFHCPVSRTHLVEVSPGQFTSQVTTQALIELGKSLGKEVVIAKDTPGFIVNRLMVPYILDAIRLMEQGVSNRDDIDASMHLGTNHPMGPLLLADYLGLDTIHSIALTLYTGLGEDRFRPPQLLEDMVRNKYYGAKSGRGFYNYANPSDKGDRKALISLKFSGFLQ